jgi:ethanolamine utilization microcompartment shell protein EutS
MLPVGVQMKPLQHAVASCDIQADARGVALTTFDRFAGSVLQ